MTTTTLLVGGIIDAAAAGMFVHVGRLFITRRSGHDDETAAKTFGWAWVALGAITIMGATRALLAATGTTATATVAWAFALAHAASLSVGLFGMMYYVLYLYTGKRRLLAPVAGAYALFGVASIAVAVMAAPTGFTVRAWDVTLAYARPRPALGDALMLVAIVGQLVATMAYVTLAFRVQDRAARYRIALVGSGLLLIFASPILVSPFVGDAWGPISVLVGLLAATATLLAYHPPRSVGEWLAGSTSTLAAQDRRARLDQRVRDLVSPVG